MVVQDFVSDPERLCVMKGVMLVFEEATGIQAGKKN
jgi:hypothetical protein